MEVINKYRKELIIICVIIEIIIVPLIFKNINELKNKDSNDNNISNINEIGKQEFGIMYRDNDTDSYKTYSGSILDAINNSYELNLTNSKCSDGSGATVTPSSVLSINGSTVTIKSNKTVYCTLYFDLKKLEITNANKVCDLGRSMSVEFTTSGPATEYYYSTNGKNFTKSSENVYSLQNLTAGGTQTIYVYARSSNGTLSETKEYSFTTKTLGNTMIASKLRASNPKDLSTDIVGDMYRYQAAPANASEAAQMTNWIMFGEECTNDYVKLSEFDKIDKYMYRIIGITGGGEMKLIKETFIKEGTVTGFAWNDRYEITPTSESYCPDGKCPDWPDSLLFKRLNGTSNGTEKGDGKTLDKEWTDIFVDSEEYDYLRSGDRVNGGTSESKWYNLISDHEWMYGDSYFSQSSKSTYNGNSVFNIETGQVAAEHFVPESPGSTTVLKESYKWPSTNKVTAKINLMYFYDYIYAYPGGNPEKALTAKNAWIHFRRDNYNSGAAYDWLCTRKGVGGLASTWYQANTVNMSGYYEGYDFFRPGGVRPVFYLKSTAKILVDGDGTRANPYKVLNY